MNHKCLYCYQPLEEGDFHPACARRFFGSTKAPALNYSLDDMVVLAREVLSSAVAVPGVQPKLSLGLIREGAKKEGHRLTIMGVLKGNYILKPPSLSYPEMPENEDLTMHLATLCGLQVAAHSLIRLQSGELAYITKRMDRAVGGGKFHQIDMMQITESYDKYRSSVEKVGKAVRTYSSNTQLDLLRLFEGVVFSFLIGNNDMHLKNYSLLLKEGRWELTPFYDLLNVHLVLPTDTEESALTINAKKQRLKREDFVALGINFGLKPKQVTATFERFLKREEAVVKLIEQSFLSQPKQIQYINLWRRRLLLFKV